MFSREECLEWVVGMCVFSDLIIVVEFFAGFMYHV